MLITHPLTRMTRCLAISLVALLLSLSMASTAYAGPDASNSVKLGVPSWPGERVKAEVASQILNSIGYQASTSNVSWIIALKSVALGQLSADMALWRPTQNSVLNPMLKAGKVTLLSTNIKDAKYDLVVPDYVWKAGVHSIADLAKHTDKFGGRIYGIEAGNDGNTLVLNAIKHNTYQLGGFQLVASSTAGMLSEVKTAVREHKWIVFLGWKPHWMNLVYHIKYLKDPQKMWGDASTVNTVINPAYAKSHPNVTRFLKQMVIPAAVQSQWIKAYGYENKPLKQVAKDWIAQNPQLIGQWLNGVTTANGKQAGAKAFTAKQ